ncbi:MAG TPA: VOC family protein [Terriglobia bacterium]|nr:VOC family protein [Terriglobia bacterium]
MKRICTTTIAACAALLLVSAAYAQVTLNSVRIGAKDTVALAKFYQAAFGMQETNRINATGGPEIFVNFGATVEAAKANKSEPIVIMHRDSDDLKDPIAHVILNVKDITATVAAIKAAGGSMAGNPTPYGTTGMMIGIAIDPGGNRIELIQRP